MDEYYVNFENNLSKIKQIASQISGTHNINSEKSELWINSQLNKRRRKICKLLIDNTTYITFNQTMKYVKKLIKKIYLTLESETVYLYIESKTDSTYFISILAVSYIRYYGYSDPIIINNLNNETLDVVGSNPILLIDDMIYSGFKLKGELDKVFTEYVIKGRKKFPNIILGVIGITPVAKENLKILSAPLSLRKELNLDKTIKLSLLNPIKFVHQIEFQPLENIIGKKKFIEMLYYFSPYNSGYPTISVYFDHKIADPTSTFLKILMYGPILPSNLKYSYEDLISSLGFENKKLLIKLFNEETDITVNKLKCIPFINGCQQNIIKKIKHLEYHWFVMSSELFKILDDLSDDEEEYNQSEDEHDVKDNNYSKKDFLKHKELIVELQNNRCPHSWYKDEILL